ncbi:hypothetical protein D3C80_1930240 [compost metagenome]
MKKYAAIKVYRYQKCATTGQRTMATSQCLSSDRSGSNMPVAVYLLYTKKMIDQASNAVAIRHARRIVLLTV